MEAIFEGVKVPLKAVAGLLLLGVFAVVAEVDVVDGPADKVEAVILAAGKAREATG